jgi:DNA polymerase-1
MQKKSLCLVDGSGYIFRAYHALPPLTNSNGDPLGAVYGFTGMLSKLISGNKKDYFAVIFDAGRKTFRNDIYPEYKAHRPPPPEDLVPQFPIFREVCDAFNVPYIELQGYEADDIIATYAKIAKESGMDVSIISADKDLMQLVDDTTNLWDPIKNKLINREVVIEKFGVPPEGVIDVQALAGDSSDNVPGVPGIGVKTAAQLMGIYGTLENLLDNTHEIKQPKRREKLTDNKELALISKRLVTLMNDVPIPQSLEEFILKKPEINMVMDFLNKCEFNTLKNRIKNDLFPGEDIIQEEVKEASFKMPKTEIIWDMESLLSVFEKAYRSGIFVFDTETTSLHIHDAKLVGVSMQVDDKNPYYIPVGHNNSSREQLSIDVVINELKKILLDPAILKVAHNLKYDMGVLFKYGIKNIESYDDTLLMSYALDTAKHPHNMDFLSNKYFNHETVSFTDVAGKGKSQKTFDEIDIDIAANYSGEDSYVTYQLHKLLKGRIFNEKRNVIYSEIDKPIIPAIISMETTGMLVDESVLDNAFKDFDKRRSDLEAEIYKNAMCEFNIGSPKQLGEVLFDNLSLKPSKKSKNGTYVTDAETLEKLSMQGHVIAEKVLKWRALSKLISTYIDGIKKAINEETKRVHTSFSLTGTATGRLASSDPNLQNIPIKTEDGRIIRKSFIASKGHKIVSFDYSQIELRLLAHVANIEPLIEAFHNNQDIHAITASQVFGMDILDVTEETRRHAKAINFGIIYGISAFGLSKQLGISRSLADQYIQKYFSQYPGIQQYMDEKINEAKNNGYVETLFGRRCYMTDINSKNYMRRQFAERQAINAPLQGSNADMMRLMMGKIPGILEENELNAKLLLQVHDEFLFEVPESEIEKTVSKISHSMENIRNLSVPVKVGIGIGNNWNEAH